MGGLGDAIVAWLCAGDGALLSGGGSIAEFEVGGFELIAGSGKAGISSSVRVSIVISFVSQLITRR